jgi:predicted DNA-binding transcriptional regulator AlpA
MAAALLRFKNLKERGIVKNHTTLKRWQKERGFPCGRLLGPNIRAWTDDEIERWLASRPVHREAFDEPSERSA